MIPLPGERGKAALGDIMNGVESPPFTTCAARENHASVFNSSKFWYVRWPECSDFERGGVQRVPRGSHHFRASCHNYKPPDHSDHYLAGKHLDTAQKNGSIARCKLKSNGLPSPGHSARLRRWFLFGESAVVWRSNENVRGISNGWERR